jgi:hypothetical protein
MYCHIHAKTTKNNVKCGNQVTIDINDTQYDTVTITKPRRFFNVGYSSVHARKTTECGNVGICIGY